MTQTPNPNQRDQNQDTSRGGSDVRQPDQGGGKANEPGRAQPGGTPGRDPSQDDQNSRKRNDGDTLHDC